MVISPCGGTETVTPYNIGRCHKVTEGYGSPVETSRKARSTDRTDK